MEKFQHTMVKGKRVRVNEVSGVKEELLEFINYEYRIMYSKALHHVSNKQYF